MPNDGARLLAGYRAVDAAVAREPGGHATSPAWMETLERFWMSGKRRLVVRKGRQGGGSTTLARVAVATALAGEHSFSAGTRLQFPFVSVTMREAAERLRNIESILRTLSEPYARRDEVIELKNRPIVFSVFPCSARLAVGMTACGIVEDEVARWWSDTANANPAIEVDSALVPSLITQPNGRIYTSSSAMGKDDFHAILMAQGDNEYQCVATGPSWYWNPTITEAATHELQPDPIRWAREFASIPQGGAINAIPEEDARAMVRPLRANAVSMGPPIGTSDPSDLQNDLWPTLFLQVVSEPGAELPYLTEQVTVCDFRGVPSVMTVDKKDSQGRQMMNPAYYDAPKLIFAIVDMLTFDPRRDVGLTWQAAIQQIATRARELGVSDIWGDSHNAYPHESIFAHHNIRFTGLASTTGSLEESSTMLRRLLRQRELVMLPGPEADATVRELIALEEVISNGHVTLRSRRSSHGHGDRASAVLLAARLVAGVGVKGAIPASPIGPSWHVREYDPYTHETTEH